MPNDRKLKVTIFAMYFPPDLGGSSTRAYNIAKGLTLNDCEVTVIAAYPHYPHGKIPEKYRWKPLVIEWMDGFKVIRTFIMPLKPEGFLKRLLIIVSFALSALLVSSLCRKSDVVWGSSWIPTLIYSKIRRKKVALNVDDLTLTDITDLKLMDEKSLIIRIGEIIYGFFYRQADIITPISPGYVSYISNRFCISPNKFKVVLAGVDLSIFKSKIKDSMKRFTILYSGALSVAYDFDQIISAAKILSLKKPEIEFIIQGSGEEASKIKHNIKKEQLRNIIFINKLYSREEVANSLTKADVLLLPMRSFGKPYLGISTKLYEYQAVGKPIICCSNGLPETYIRETKSGVVVKPGDYKSLAKSIMYLENNIDVANELGKNGRKYVEINISLDIIGSKMKELLKCMLKLRK